MQINLVVVRPFGNFKRGDVIAQEAEVTSVLGGEHAFNVVRIPAVATTASAKGV